MLAQFEAYMASQISLDNEQLAQISALAIPRELRRRQIILHEGEICRYKIFVVKGLLRIYRAAADGNEYIMRFAPENTWMIDPESYNNQLPTKYIFEALEPSEVLLWPRESLEAVMDKVPVFKAYSDRLKTTTLDATQNRVLMNISGTAEEKYEEFIRTFPEVFRRVPLHMVASYLGLSRETLSRVRNAQFKRAAGKVGS